MLRDGRLHLSGIALLSPHLDQENRDEVLARASHLSKRQVEELVAELAPRRDAPTLVRRLPSPSRGRVEVTPRPGRREPLPVTPMEQHRPDDVAGGGKAADVAADGTEPADPRATVAPSAGTIGLQRGATDRVSLEPLAPSRYRVQFTASAGLKKKLERLQVLMRTAVPDGDLATLIEDAVTEKIAHLEARRLGAAQKPRKSVAQSDTRRGPRSIPAAVKRAVRQRDGDRCTYVDAQGRRCSERNHLQFHHRVPHGFGGDRAPRNIAQVCRSHNLFEAEADFPWGSPPGSAPA